MSTENMISIEREKYEELNHADKLFMFFSNFMSFVKSGCFSNQYGCIANENIPDQNDFEQVLTWADTFCHEGLNAIQNYARLKKHTFAKSSEKSKSTDKFSDEYITTLSHGGKVTILPTEDQYREALQKVRLRIKEINEQNKVYSDQGEIILNECKRTLEQLKILQKIEDAIVKNGYRTNYSAVKPEDGGNDNSSSSSLTPENNQDANNISVANEDEIHNIIENAKHDKKKFLKNKKANQQERLDFLNSATQDVPQGNRVEPVVPQTFQSPITAQETRGCISATEKRMRELINVIFRNLLKTFNATFPVRTIDGQYFELSAATCPDVLLRDNNDNVSYLNCKQLLPADSKEVDELKKQHSLYPYSAQFRAIVYISQNNTLIYSPLEHYGAAGYILGMRAAFMRCELTENSLISIYVNFFEFMTSKSLVAKWFNDVTGQNYSRQYIIKLIIGFTRVLDGLVETTVEYALNNANTLHFDETKYTCVHISGSCYMWVAVSGKHEAEPFCLFFASKGRGHEQFLQMFGIEKNDNGEFESPNQLQLPLQGIVTDGHSAYPKGIQVLKDYVQGILNHGACLVHVRREFFAALEVFGVLKIYQKSLRSAHNDTFQNVFEQYLKENDLNNIDSTVYTIVHLTYIIDMILGLDTDFICKNADDIMERRLEYSKPLLDEFFSIIDNFVNSHKEYFIEHTSTSEGQDKISYSCGASFRFIKALVYALNHRTTMYAFLQDGDIETHNNIAESTIRKCVRQRDNMLFLYSEGGFEAYGKAMTLMGICDMLGINKYRYIQWAFDCAKKELFEIMYNTPNRGSAKSNCYIPNVQKDENGNTINFYDKEYQCIFDTINWSQFNPYAYNKRLNEELEILMQISKEKFKDIKPHT